MRIPALIAVACLFAAPVLVRAQGPRPPTPVQGPEAPETPPTFELDKTGKRAHIEFTNKVKPISDPSIPFTKFAGHKTLILYFSAKCPHCQHAFPFVQKLADSLATKGVTTVAMAVKFNTDEDIHGFIRDFNARMPIFQDDDRSFGELYGTGYVPLLLLVNEKGEYVRYKTFNEEETPKWILSEVRVLSKK